MSSSLNVYQRRRKMDLSDNQWLPSTLATSASSSHNESLIIPTPLLVGDNESATKRVSFADLIADQELARNMNNVAPLSQSFDLNDKFPELLQSFGISTPGKPIPLEFNSHVFAESEEGNLGTVTERADMADPIIYSQESAITGIETGSIPQCGDLNDKLAELFPNYGISTPRKPIPLELNSHVSAESLIFASPLEVELGTVTVTATERADIADPIYEESAITEIETASLPQCFDLNEKIAAPLPSFGFLTPRKPIPQGPNSHVSAESSIFTPLREGDLETVTERAHMADPIYDQEESATTEIESVSLPQGCDLNARLTESSLIFGISTPGKPIPPGPETHVSAESSILAALMEGDLETVIESGHMADPIHDQESATAGIETTVPLPQSFDLSNAKLAEPLPSFGISTPGKPVPMGPDSHVSTESSILAPTRDGDLETMTESARMAEPLHDQESATTGIETVSLLQGSDLNDKAAESSPIFGISTPASIDKKRKVNGQNHLETPKKKKKVVFWPKVVGQTKRKTKLKVPSESSKTSKRKNVSAVNGDKGKYKRTPKSSKSAKKSEEGASEVDGGKLDLFCYEPQLNVDKYEVQHELLSTLKEHVISEKTSSRPKRKSCKRTLIFEQEENLEEPLHMQHGLDELGFEGDSLQISRKKTPQKRINLSCPLLVRVRRMELNIPMRKRSENQKKKRIRECELPFLNITKRKRSGNRRRKTNLYDILIRKQQVVEEEKNENRGWEVKFTWKIKRRRTTRRKKIRKVEPTNFTEDTIPKQEFGRWEIREKSKALCPMRDFVEYPLDEDDEENDVKDKRKGKMRRKVAKTKAIKIPNKEMKVLIKKFQSLNLNKEKKGAARKNQDKRLVPYKGTKGCQRVKANVNDSELVPYENQDGKLVSYTGLKEKQRIKVKVDLDSETLKEWNLIMSGKPYDESEDKKEYWKQERSIYLGRVHAFIARMHNFLGNRSFTPWKGSVLDSVIGVFLTQNVSDHLSSSAYMSLASVFPIKEGKDNSVPLLRLGDSSSEANTANNNANLGMNKKLYSPGIVFGKKKSVSTKKKVDQTEEERKKKEEEEAEEQDKQYWESLRKMYIHHCYPRSSDHADSIDWEAVRCADVNKVAKAIEGRGQHNIIAQRIQALLNKLVEMHGSVDLEWLRYAPPNLVKEYLLKVYGLGLKSVECIRLLALEQIAFPVDVNVGRIAVRLGWVPLEPLPGSIQFHLLDQYPIIDVVQQYLWPRLCTLDQPTLYQLHYHLITFGKVLCTKKQPNCRACPMRAECKHYASASASPTLALPANDGDGRPNNNNNSLVRLDVAAKHVEGFSDGLIVSNGNEASTSNNTTKKQCEPIIDYPSSPSLESTQFEIEDIEDLCKSDHEFEEFYSIDLHEEHFKAADSYFERNAMENSKVVVAFNPNRASKFMPKMKNVSRLRTERMVYVLPDTHPLLSEFPMREADDPSNYLLVMWTPEELKETGEATQNQCNCPNNTACFTCNNTKEENSPTVPGSILVPCRTARNGRFPLNGTYFQVNEVFADADSSQHPIHVPTKWLWNLPTRIAYFGTSTSTILRGLSLEEIQECFWRGYVCVRGSCRRTGAPRALPYRFHCKTTDQQILKKKRQKNNNEGLNGNESGHA